MGVFAPRLWSGQAQTRIKGRGSDATLEVTGTLAGRGSDRLGVVCRDATSCESGSLYWASTDRHLYRRWRSVWATLPSPGAKTPCAQALRPATSLLPRRAKAPLAASPCSSLAVAQTWRMARTRRPTRKRSLLSLDAHLFHAVRILAALRRRRPTAANIRLRLSSLSIGVQPTC